MTFSLSHLTSLIVAFFVLFCFVLFCFVLFFVCLFCFVLFCFVLFCFVLFCFVLFCFVLFCFVLFCWCFCFFPVLTFFLSLSVYSTTTTVCYANSVAIYKSNDTPGLQLTPYKHC